MSELSTRQLAFRRSRRGRASRDLQPQPLLLSDENFWLSHCQLYSYLVWSSDGSILASESSLHRVNYELVLGSMRRQATLGYRSSTCWTVPAATEQHIEVKLYFRFIYGNNPLRCVPLAVFPLKISFPTLLFLCRISMVISKLRCKGIFCSCGERCPTSIF